MKNNCRGNASALPRVFLNQDDWSLVGANMHRPMRLYILRRTRGSRLSGVACMGHKDTALPTTSLVSIICIPYDMMVFVYGWR